MQRVESCVQLSNSQHLQTRAKQVASPFTLNLTSTASIWFPLVLVWQKEWAAHLFNQVDLYQILFKAK